MISYDNWIPFIDPQNNVMHRIRGFGGKIAKHMFFIILGHFWLHMSGYQGHRVDIWSHACKGHHN